MLVIAKQSWSFGSLPDLRGRGLIYHCVLVRVLTLLDLFDITLVWAGWVSLFCQMEMEV